MQSSVQASLKSKFGQSSASIIKEKAAEKRRDNRVLEKNAAKVLDAAVQRGRSRPMLYEQGATDHAAAGNLAFVKATHKMMNMMRAAGEKHPETLLSPEDRARLEDEELKTQMAERRKGMGR